MENKILTIKPSYTEEGNSESALSQAQILNDYEALVEAGQATREITPKGEIIIRENRKDGRVLFYLNQKLKYATEEKIIKQKTKASEIESTRHAGFPIDPVDAALLEPTDSEKRGQGN